MEYHEIICIHSNDVEGQIGIKLKNKINDFLIGIVGFYLSPDNNRYGRDSEGFFNNAAALWEDFSDCDLLLGSGDLNARTKETLDYIPDIDGDFISKRSNPDQTKNSHGDSFLTFLKENRTIILNGRITPHLNNFTFVSPHRGVSVPDYQFCPVDHIQYSTEMKTLLMSDIVNSFKLHPPLNLPDHSILLGTFSTSFFDVLNNCKQQSETYFDRPKETLMPQRPHKKDLKKMKETFFMTDQIKEQVELTILKLETLTQNQSELDTLWSEVKHLLLNELDTLPDLPKSEKQKF